MSAFPSTNLFAALSLDPSNLLSKVDSLCNLIMKTDTENWEVRNKAVLHIVELIEPFQGQSVTLLNEAFDSEFFRAIKEPVKSLVGDAFTLYFRASIVPMLKHNRNIPLLS